MSGKPEVKCLELRYCIHKVRIKCNKKGEKKIREKELLEIKSMTAEIVLVNELEDKFKKIFQKLK